LKYRAEIDGLRALAVVPVILFHAGFESFSGGFIGVDVFFVISGYLITTILIEDFENDRFSIVNFYERRARRILPALFFVMLVCIPFAWLWLLPGQMVDFSESLIAVSLFVSNILFWSETGYFDTFAEEKPLLHTWSLAVEEQYYVLFPIFLLLVWRFGKNRVFWMIVVSAAISLTLSEWGWRNKATANFYIAPTRAWELLAGSIAAFIAQKHGVRAHNAMSLLGLFAIVFSIFAYDESTPFPSVYALVPVVGVVLLVLFADKTTLVAKILSTKIFVSIGLISYSAYLWHQPLFVFARLGLEDNNSGLVMLSLCAVSIVLAFISRRFIEQPFRKKDLVSRKNVFLLSALGASVFIALGGWVVHKNGYVNSEYDLAPNLEWQSLGEKLRVVGDVCDLSDPIENTRFLVGCEFGSLDGTETIILMGDSHAQAISYYLNDQFRNKGVRGLYLGIKDCQYIPYNRRNKDRSVTDCDVRFEELLSFLGTKNSPVILINRWTFRLFPMDGSTIEMPYRNSFGDVEREKYREYHVLKDGEFYSDASTKKDALTKFVTKMSEVSRPLVLVFPIPETAIDIEANNRLHFQEYGKILTDLSIPYSDYQRRNEFVINVLESAVKSNPIIPVRPEGLFCDYQKCNVQVQKVPLYYDDDHLSYEGSKLLVNKILNELNY